MVNLNLKKLTDNGKEFENKTLKEWVKKQKIEHKFSIPYFHQSNGRIERVNRTIREAIKRTPGILKIKLKTIIENYNNAYHRGIGMSPNSACLPENETIVLENSIKYEKEFKEKKCFEFKVGNKVLLKNENKRTKMDDEFSEEGTIKNKIGNNIYEIIFSNGKTTKRHASQLKLFERGMLDA
jgi:hypothetical protein